MNKLIRATASNLVWALCRPLPVQKNKVVFSSMGGAGFGGNPKAIALALLELDKTLDLVWLTKNENTPLPAGIRPCRFGTPKAVKELSTAKVWVNDSRGGAKYKKKLQKYLQTWHGFALKKIEAAAELPDHYVNQCKKDSAMIDLIPSGSGFMTRCFREDFWYSGEVAPFGTPRNDVFFHETGAAERVKTHFHLPLDQKLVLYAPTFRDGGETDCYGLDAENLRLACEERFGGNFSVLIRLHPNAAKLADGLFSYNCSAVIDATPYPDMQELLLAADLLITDYSSAMFDFALSGKPCLQFATDVDRYSAGRGFYFPLRELPFPLAQSNEELLRIVLTFDEEAQRARWNDFAKSAEFYEDGSAAMRCARWIHAQLKG